MRRLLIDVSSLLWQSLLASKDKEFGREVEHEGKMVHVNGWQYGYECAINHLTSVMRELDVAPIDCIFVVEGQYAKSRRKAIYADYKAGRDSRPPEAYAQFGLLRDRLTQDFRNLGSQIVTQDGVEGDDIIAYLARNLDGEKVILTTDGDLATLIDESTSLWRGDKLTRENPYGPFPCRFIPVYKALCGDGNEYKGAAGFGPKAFLSLLTWLINIDSGLAALEGMMKRQTLSELEDDVGDFKPFRKVIDNAQHVYQSYQCALLHDDWVSTLRQPLEWKAGMVQPRDRLQDARLHKWARSVTLVTRDNYAQSLVFLMQHLAESRFFCLDLETTVPEESDEWLSQRTSRGGGVDVIASTIVGCGLSFGANQRYGFYCSVDHADTNNITLDQLRELLEVLPRDKITVAHNAAGFELPVLFNAFGAQWKNNGYRGLFPNMVDSRIAASYWDENQPSHALKQLSSKLLDYQQETYAELTGGRKMDQLSAQHVLSYGVDDVFCTGGIWNLFVTIMEIEHTWDAFLRIEQRPMYLSAMSYVQGTPISLERLFKLKSEDDEKYAEYEKTLHTYLVEKGWGGTRCPVITELTPANVKEAVRIILGEPLETAVRTISKLAKLIEVLEHEDAPLLAKLVADSNVEQINDWMARRFVGTPDLNVGSNKQLTTLLYETMGLPVRLRNKPTDTMRAKGIREGNPRADDDAMSMAIKRGDASPEVAPVLEALSAMKSINTKRGLYWDAYPNMVHWKDRRLHPELRQCATNTRRHTSGNPNIQQLDGAYGGVRSVILPHHKDAVIVSCDLAGQEIRLLADMSRDENMMSAYMGDDLKDLHSFTAAMILGISYEEFRARYKSEDPAISGPANDARQSGKITFFASSYGAMAPKIAEGLGIEDGIAQDYLDALDKAFPRVNIWKKETEEFASKHGWVPLHGGTRRHLRELLLSGDKWTAQKALRQASNARIQGAGGNQLRTIMGRIWDSDLIDKYDFQFYWPVHDECVFSVGRRDAVEVIKKFHALMCEQFLDLLPSASSIGIGSSFGTLTEIGEVPDDAKIQKAVDDVFSPCVVCAD